MDIWKSHRNELYQRWPELTSDADFLTSSTSGSVIVAHTKANAFSGEGQEPNYAALVLCTAGGGRARKEYKEYNGIILDDVWRPGRVGFALPTLSAKGFAPSMELLMIAFQPNNQPFCHSEPFDVSELAPATSQLMDDELISSVMIALLKDAEAHGAASMFFEHGLSLILNRLKKHCQVAKNSLPLLPEQKFKHLFSIIEERLDEDLRVTELANIVGVSEQTLTRFFKKETGYTPFMYLTRRRIERAKTMLKQDHAITDIALSVGYNNPAKFSAAFRRWVGMAPSSWRNRVIKKLKKN